MNIDDKYFTTKDASALLECSEAYVRIMIAKGKLTAVKFNRSYLVDKNSVTAYVDKIKGMSKNDPRRGREPKS